MVQIPRTLVWDWDLYLYKLESVYDNNDLCHVKTHLVFFYTTNN